MCTSIVVKYDEGMVMARTMDFEVPLDYSLIYIPKNTNYTKDLLGNKLYNKYKMMGMNFYDKYPIKDGINEHGLVATTNLFLTMNCFSDKTDEKKINLASIDYLSYALGNYKNCKELVEDLDNIAISTKDTFGNKAETPDFHYYFIDQEGASYVIEAHKQKLTAYENPYRVMTNSPSFPSHIKKLEKFLASGKTRASRDLPGSYDPSARFIRAYLMTNSHIEVKTSKEAMAAAYNILETVSIPKGPIANESHNFYTYTRYRSAFDTKGRYMTVRTENNHKIYSLSFEDMKNQKDLCFIKIPNEFEMESLV